MSAGGLAPCALSSLLLPRPRPRPRRPAVSSHLKLLLAAKPLLPLLPPLPPALPKRFHPRHPGGTRLQTCGCPARAGRPLLSPTPLFCAQHIGLANLSPLNRPSLPPRAGAVCVPARSTAQGPVGARGTYGKWGSVSHPSDRHVSDPREDFTHSPGRMPSCLPGLIVHLNVQAHSPAMWDRGRGGTSPGQHRPPPSSSL